MDNVIKDEEITRNMAGVKNKFMIFSGKYFKVQVEEDSFCFMDQYYQEGLVILWGLI